MNSPVWMIRRILQAMQRTTLLALIAVAVAAFLAGHGSLPGRVKADEGESPSIAVQSVRGDTSLTVYYPSQKKLFVYQTPFVGAPTWNCSYSIQLSTPGGSIERQQCPGAGQQPF
jgi:hypothetical protein